MSESKTVTVIMDGDTNNEHFHFGCRYAVVDFTEALLARLSELRARHAVALVEDRTLARHVYADYTPAWYEPGCNDPGLVSWVDESEDTADGDIVDDLHATDLGNDANWVYASDVENWDRRRMGRRARTEADELEVDDRGVRWCCVPKHCENTEAWTPWLYWSDIEDIAQKLTDQEKING